MPLAGWEFFRVKGAESQMTNSYPGLLVPAVLQRALDAHAGPAVKEGAGLCD